MAAKKRKSNDIQRGLICRLDDRHHFRLYESLADNEGFLSLPFAAQMLYLRMGLESKGRMEFAFPHSCYSKYMSTNTFIKAKRALIEGGFITETRYRCSKNMYRLSNGWLNKNCRQIEGTIDGEKRGSFEK